MKNGLDKWKEHVISEMLSQHVIVTAEVTYSEIDVKTTNVYYWVQFPGNHQFHLTHYLI